MSEEVDSFLIVGLSTEIFRLSIFALGVSAARAAPTGRRLTLASWTDRTQSELGRESSVGPAGSRRYAGGGGSEEDERLPGVEPASSRRYGETAPAGDGRFISAP